MTGYQMIKNGISIGIIIFIVAVILFVIRFFLHKRKKDQIVLLISLCLLLLCFPVYFAVSVKQYTKFDLQSLKQFTVTSEDLHDGIWDPVISNTEKGKNLSPQLSWEPVKGAKGYVVYMIDPDGYDWIHMKTDSLTDTSLSRGEIPPFTRKDPDGPGYIGPYPPSGTHTYEVYVFALRNLKDGYVGKVNQVSNGIDQISSLVDVNENGDIGNIIAYGKLSGTYTR